MACSDWQKPTTPVLSRISDARAVQFWDEKHLVAKELRQHVTKEPECCEENGYLWDVVALYPKENSFSNASPTFIGGPVVRAVPRMTPQLQDTLRKRESHLR
jgi:hypothetical protein